MNLSNHSRELVALEPEALKPLSSTDTFDSLYAQFLAVRGPGVVARTMKSFKKKFGMRVSENYRMEDHDFEVLLPFLQSLRALRQHIEESQIELQAVRQGQRFFTHFTRRHYQLDVQVDELMKVYRRLPGRCPEKERLELWMGTQIAQCRQDFNIVVNFLHQTQLTAPLPAEEQHLFNQQISRATEMFWTIVREAHQGAVPSPISTHSRYAHLVEHLRLLEQSYPLNAVSELL